MQPPIRNATRKKGKTEPLFFDEAYTGAVEDRDLQQGDWYDWDLWELKMANS